MCLKTQFLCSMPGWLLSFKLNSVSWFSYTFFCKLYFITNIFQDNDKIDSKQNDINM